MPKRKLYSMSLAPYDGSLKGKKKNKKKEAKKAKLMARIPPYKREGIFDILELPWEIRNIIFKNMNKITSVCAGLTCKVLWRHHRKYHHTVDLLHRSTHRDVGCLPMLLREWMAPERIFRFGHSFYTEKEFQATLYYRQVRKIQIEQIKLITKERKELQAAQDAK